MNALQRFLNQPLGALAICLALVCAQVCRGQEPSPVPDDAEVRIALVTVRELYGAQLERAKGAAEKKALALRVKKAADETVDDPISRFAALKFAQQIAVEAGDFDVAREIVERRAEVYKVERQTELIQLLQHFASISDSAQQHLYVAKQGLALTDEFFAAGHVNAAAQAGKIAYRSAQQSRNAEVTQALVELGSRVTLARKREAALAEAFAAVTQSPNDPAANLRYGQLLCFGKSRWDEGMPYLAKSNSELATVARDELAAEADRPAALQLADAWKQLSNSLKDEHKSAALARAGYWYEQALAAASGLTKRRVEKALEDLEAVGIKPLAAGSTSAKGALSCRHKECRRELLAKYGGDEVTEKAVQAALIWLAKCQRPDGSWSRMGPYGEGATQENATAATAMAILAFQGAGHTHVSGEYKAVLAKAWTWLLAKQANDGDYVKESLYNARLYTQAQCTIAICELYALTKDERLRKSAQLAVDFTGKSQDSDGGGWRYTPRQDSDLSVTAWFASALHAAELAGLEVPNETVDNLKRFLDAAQHQEGAAYSYKPNQGLSRAMTAAGLLCRQQTGWKSDDSRLKDGRALLRQMAQEGDQRDIYFIYYATQVMFQTGAKDWNDWNAILKNDLPKRQTPTGKEAGSWNPSDDRWGAHGGRLYVTCLNTYCLQAYYRHPPMLK